MYTRERFLFFHFFPFRYASSPSLLRLFPRARRVITLIYDEFERRRRVGRRINDVPLQPRRALHIDAREYRLRAVLPFGGALFKMVLELALAIIYRRAAAAFCKLVRYIRSLWNVKNVLNFSVCLAECIYVARMTGVLNGLLRALHL